MRRGPSKLVTAVAVVSAAMLAGCGCEARVYGTPPESALTVVVPQGSMAPLPEAPLDEPPASFAGLDDRIQQAVADAAGADISVVVLDRSTGQMVRAGTLCRSPSPRW